MRQPRRCIIICVAVAFNESPIVHLYTTKKHLRYGDASCWDTRIRTWNDRTRICSVTITPYPIDLTTHFRIASAKLALFLELPKLLPTFFMKRDKNILKDSFSLLNSPNKPNRNKLLNKMKFILCFIPFALPLHLVYYNVI